MGTRLYDFGSAEVARKYYSHIRNMKKLNGDKLVEYFETYIKSDPILLQAFKEIAEVKRKRDAGRLEKTSMRV
jgi:hypothetical protein